MQVLRSCPLPLSVLSSSLFCSSTVIGYSGFDPHWAARKHLCAEVFQRVLPKLPKPHCECSVSRRHYSYWREKMLWGLSPYYEVNIDVSK